jgi:hypothetical protein
MIMEDLDNQGVLAGINVIVLQGTRPEEHMKIQGWKESKVCLMSYIREGYMDKIACKGS